MKKYYFPLGFSCNENCLHCFLPMWKYHQQRNYCDLTTEEVKNILQEAKEVGVEVIALTGGEPTMRKDLTEIIKFCKKLNFDKIELQTNGKMLSYNSLAKKVVECGVTDIYPSFHTYVESLQDFITQSKGSFKASLQGLKNILKLNVRVQTNTVISKLNYKVLDKLVTFFHKEGVREIELDFLRPAGNAWKNFNIVVPRKSEIAPYIVKALEVAENLGFESIFVDDYPLCFMKKFKQYNADYIAMRQGERHDEQAFGVFKNSEPVQIHKDQKFQGQVCGNCMFNKYCEGDWKEYIEKIGWDEFNPIKCLD